jgi:hypothetical protein
MDHAGRCVFRAEPGKPTRIDEFARPNAARRV